MKDLRVNSKTKISEFKRKHNWLVENSAIKLNVSNIKSLSNEDIENLNCGDIVLKEDASGKHAYLVSFKNETGMCLTYCDASVIETQSYDKVGENWTYNSEDKTPNLLDVQTENDVKNLIEGGTIENAKPLYFHGLDFSSQTGQSIQIHVLNNSPTLINKNSFKTWIEGITGIVNCQCNGCIKINDVYKVAYLFRKQPNNSYAIYYVDETSGFTYKSYADYDSLPFASINDAVNKIN